MTKLLTTALLIFTAFVTQAQNQPSKMESFTFNTVTGNSWNLIQQVDYSYHTNPDSVQAFSENYDMSTMTYSKEDNSYKVFSKDDRFLRSVKQVWTNGKYENSKKELKTYSAVSNNGNQSFYPRTHLFFNWNSKQGWDTFEINTYDVKLFTGTVNGYTKQRKWKGSWINVERYTYTYFSSNKIATEEYEVWVSNAWEKRLKKFYTYQKQSTDYNNIITKRYDKGNYVLYLKEDYVFKSNKLDSLLRSQYNLKTSVYDETGFTEYNYNKDGDLYEEVTSSGPKSSATFNTRILYSYNNNVSNVEIENVPNLAYPNPVKNTLHINNTDKWVSGKLFDIMGQVIQSYTSESFNNQTLDMSAIPSNTYYLLLESKEGKSYSQKLIVKH